MRLARRGELDGRLITAADGSGGTPSGPAATRPQACG